MSHRGTVSSKIRLDRRVSRAATALLTCALVVALSACATRPGMTTDSPSPTESVPSPSLSSAATASPGPTDGAVPVPTEDPTLPDPSPTTQGDTKVTIVNSGADGSSVFASGLVTGDAGSGGVCTLTATGGGVVLTGQIEAQATPAAINCGLIEIAAGSGTWTLTLTYRAGSVTAASAPVTVSQE